MSVTLTLSSEPTSSGIDASRRSHLNRAVEHAGNLLPISGPITAFAFLNTLQALEDLPFDEGLTKGARLFGAQPYLREERYRERVAQGRIRLSDLVAVLKADLGERAEEPLGSFGTRFDDRRRTWRRPGWPAPKPADVPMGSFGTRFDLRLAMMRHPLRLGPLDELRWFVAETDALTRLREEAPDGFRNRFIEETKHWIMRDVRNGHAGPLARSAQPHDALAHGLLATILAKFGDSSIEQWSEETWEAFSLQALWRICFNGVRGITSPPPCERSIVRHRDVLRHVTGEDTDLLVHDVLIRFCAAFVDQGLAHWTLPNREQGFYKSFFALYRQSGGPPNPWLRGLPNELARLEATGCGPLESIIESLELLGVPDVEWDDYITESLLRLRGWAGMLWQMEVRADRVPLPVDPGTLAEFLAVRLILERLALDYVTRKFLPRDTDLKTLRSDFDCRTIASQATIDEQRAFLIFQLAQVLEWTPPALYRLTPDQWRELVAEIEVFSELERRRVFHQAYERQFHARALDALSVYTKRPAMPVKSPRFQAVLCIDAREESFRRHIEEVSPDVETYSAAGFFGVAMYYRGAADAHFTALCPIVVRPKHWVVEDVVYTFENSNRRRAKTRRALGSASHQLHVGSRSIAGGAILTASLGVLASIPLVARVLFPRLTARIRRTAGHFVAPPEATRLRLERESAEPGPNDGQIGFTVEEMANIGERMLREISFSTFSRLILLLGHGSFCLNNPHKSAYDCGACTGSAGSPNARALAAILNDVRVREILATRGLVIPRETVFLGGLHNTCDDSVSFLDLDLLPRTHFHDFEAARRTLEQACERNAHERCRRFESAPLNLSFSAALLHVEARSQDLAQTRPEFGNASNAMCVVARRSRTRGLYLDRRSFLTSYDPTQDDADYTVLTRILSAVVPVCEGISMTYFLSSIDSPGWGCGTKLPHNVTSLLGVMDGAASDLRPGLPWQGVEIHEPVRCLFVIESTPQAMIQIMDKVEVIGRILRRGWAKLAVLDPESSQIHVFENNEFRVYAPETEELPKAITSTEWYWGWRDHLGFAAIEPDVAAVK